MTPIRTGCPYFLGFGHFYFQLEAALICRRLIEVQSSISHIALFRFLKLTIRPQRLLLFAASLLRGFYRQPHARITQGNMLRTVAKVFRRVYYITKH